MSQNVNIFVESKNAPKSQKCKINFNLFFDMGVTILEEGGGLPTWELFTLNQVFYSEDVP